VWGDNPGFGPALYDEQNDFFQEHNIADEKPDVVEEMKTILADSFETDIS
jgi:hypothetical protein